MSGARALGLSEDVQIDYRDAQAWARSVLSAVEAFPTWGLTHIMVLTREILPDWYDEWLLPARERHRQLRLHALETLCALLTRVGRFGEAIQAGLSAVSIEPLRESAHLRVIEAHLAENNLIEALRQYRLLETLLLRELGLRPSPTLRRLIRKSDGAR